MKPPYWMDIKQTGRTDNAIVCEVSVRDVEGLALRLWHDLLRAQAVRDGVNTETYIDWDCGDGPCGCEWEEWSR
jgi:hypothetical protein